MGCTVLVVCLYKFSTQGTTYFYSIAKEVVAVSVLQPWRKKKKKKQRCFNNFVDCRNNKYMCSICYSV